jgi:hypothetical protein
MSIRPATRSKAQDEVLRRVETPEHAPAPAEAVTAEEVKKWVEAKLQTALEEARERTRPLIAEPLFWWEIYAFVIQPGAQLVPPASFFDNPLLPHKVIRVGQQAFIVTVVILNPFRLPQDPNIVPCDFLSIFSLPYEIDYHTCNLTECKKGPANQNARHSGHLVPGQCFYVDVLEFTAQEEGCIFETNVCARILGCEHDGNRQQQLAPPFAGFARTTINLDPELFFPSPLLGFDNPLRYMVYE